MTEIPTERDRVASRLIETTIVGACVAIAASALVVWLLSDRIAYGGGRSDEVTMNIEPPADPFELLTTHEQHRREQLRALESFQWANTDHTRALIPLELAIDRYLAGAR
jgi:hypothetical protein